MINNKQHYVRNLIAHMGAQGLEPFDQIKIDGQSHTYDAYINDKLVPARYLAVWYPLGNDGPTLLCTYGPIHSNKTFTFSA